MRWSDLPLNPSRRQLRQFAALWIVFFGGLALWQWVAAGHAGRATVLAIAAATVGPLGLVFPWAVRPIFLAWLTLSFPVGWIVSRLLLVALFVFIVCPVAMVFRMLGRDALLLRGDRHARTYWTALPAPKDRIGYIRQS